MTECVAFDRVREAAARIKNHIIRTPLLRLSQLDRFFDGAEVYVKPETLQPIASFKIRGATNKILDLAAAGGVNGVITVSSGNHGQGVAYAAGKSGIKATVVMPEIASRLKADKARGYGADVIISGKNNNEAEVKALEIMEREGLHFVHAYSDPLVIAGQGTIGLEILEDQPDMDAVICPVGGGGLISGIALAAKSLRPETKIYGVEPALVPRYAESQKAGKPLTLYPGAVSMADGTRTMSAKELNLAMINRYVDRLVSVEETMIKEALKLAVFETKLLMETSSAMTFAAALNGGIPLSAGQKICFILSGGNISYETIKELLG